MAVNPASTPGMAVAYLEQLDLKLRRRTPEFELWERYYEGIHRLQFATSRFRQTFGNLFHEFADNWMGLIVDASVERLNIEGFRVGTDGDNDTDQDAWAMFRDNGLDWGSDIAHTEAVKLGKAYLLVDPHNRTDLGNPIITVEHPGQCVTAHVADNRMQRQAGLKEWLDHSGYVYANVYFPDATYRFQTDVVSNSQDKYNALTNGVVGLYGNLFPMDYIGPPAMCIGEHAHWIPRQDGQPFIVPNPLGVVPLIPMENNPTLKSGGRSDIAPIIPIQDAINKVVLDMIIASEFAGFPQRWATGIEIPKDPETGQPISDPRFLASVARVWAVEDEGAKFGQFQVSELKNYVVAIEMLIQHVAAITRTPPHYLLGQSGAFPSGDSLAATETGLVAKCKRKMTNFSPAWEEALRLGFKANGDARALQPMETVWSDPEQRIRAARIDGALKMSTLGVPQDGIWEELGASPGERKRWHNMRKAMGLAEYGPEFAPIPPPPAPAQVLGPDGKPIPGQKPPNEGPEGNLVQEQAISQSVRVARVHD